MDGLSKELFSRSGFSGDQNWGVCLRINFSQRFTLIHEITRSKNIIKRMAGYKSRRPEFFSHQAFAFLQSGDGKEDESSVFVFSDIHVKRGN